MQDNLSRINCKIILLFTRYTKPCFGPDHVYVSIREALIYLI